MVRIYPKRPELFLNKGTRYLIDSEVLEYIKLITSDYTKIVQVGAGTGCISTWLPQNTILVESDLRNTKALSKFSHVLWKSIFDVSMTQIDSCDTLVSNLPYDRGVSILLHCVNLFSNIKHYFVILQEQVVNSILNQRGSLHHKFNHLFEVHLHKIIPNTSFDPIPTVNGALIELTPRVTKDWGFIKFLNTLHYPRKTLHNNGLIGCLKRVNELSTAQLHQLFLQHLDDTQLR